MLPVNSLNMSQNNPNFGFKVLVKENSKLVDMTESYLFRELPKDTIELFKTKAAAILPDRTVIVEPSIRRPKPFECFDANFYTNNEKVDNIIDYDSHALLTFLKRATNKFTKVHSRFFYNGEQSPEMIARTEKFRETSTRPFTKFKDMFSKC